MVVILWLSCSPLFYFWSLNILIVQYSVAATAEMPTPPDEDQVEFDSDFVKQPAGQSVDFTRFSNGANVLPGVYKIAVALNQQTLTVTEVEFKATDNKNVIPCIPLSVLNLINFKKIKLTSLSGTPLLIKPNVSILRRSFLKQNWILTIRGSS